MGRFTNICIAQAGNSILFTGGGMTYMVVANNGAYYYLYCDNGSDLVFKKSTNRGLSWSIPVVVYAGAVNAMAIWYDRWSGISGDLIHCVFSDTGNDDIMYRSIDTASSDALGTQTTVFLGTTTAADCSLAITRARGGNLVVAGSIDAGAEDGTWESADVGATWTSTIADASEGGAGDGYMLLPGWNADTQDVQLIFWDDSADELSVKRYDDSGNVWNETSISTGMVDLAVANGWPHMYSFVDLANSRNIVAAWSAVDTASARLRVWSIDDTTITALTDIVSSSTDDQGLVALTLDTDTGYWHAYYTGATDGSETWPTAVNLYTKVSKDQGTTWGPETKISPDVREIRWIATAPRSTNQWIDFVAFHDNQTGNIDLNSIFIDYTKWVPKATFQLAI
jgi:hypothetical protein